MLKTNMQEPRSGPALSQLGQLLPILHTLVQVDWEPGPTEIVPNWAPAPPKAGPDNGVSWKLLNSRLWDLVVCLPNDIMMLSGDVYTT